MPAGEANGERGESRCEALLHGLDAIVWEADPSLRFSFVSRRAEDVLGYSVDRWLGEPGFWSKRIHPDDRERALALRRVACEQGRDQDLEYRAVCADGTTVWLRDIVKVDRGDDGAVRRLCGVMVDITRQKEREEENRQHVEEQIAYLANYDELTGLPNMALLRQRLELALTRARRHGVGVAVLHVDLKAFREVNDSLGHAAGDELLRQTALRLREAARGLDAISRESADHFVVVAADLELGGSLSPDDDARPSAAAAAEAVGAQLHDTLGAPLAIDGHELLPRATVGVSLFPFDADDGETLLQHAQAAVEQGRMPDGSATQIYAGGSGFRKARFALATRLRKAIVKGEFALHYQPIVGLSDSGASAGGPTLAGGARVVALEALIRWPTADGELVPPLEFIPLAEDIGLIDTIGDWVLAEVARQSSAWSKAGLAIDVSFNFSLRQLWQPSIGRRVTEEVRSAGVDPSSLIIEITESAAMTDPDRTELVLRELRDEGFHIAIDDFGTGHSSLGRLWQLPVDKLKIDLSFVGSVPGNRAAEAMIRAVVQMADSLGMQALAEGIETEEQLRFLREHGCLLGQGFLFSAPVPADQVPALLGGEGALTVPVRP